MSFPDKEQRKLCWDSRDRYWECLDDQNIKDNSQKPKVCAELRRAFEKSCPTQWVTHFDRKRDFNIFKEKMQKEGFEPIKDQQVSKMEELRLNDNITSHITKHLSTSQIQNILISAKRAKKSENNLNYWNELAETLWTHIQNGLYKMDDQMLYATCFFSLIVLTDKEDVYLNNMQEIIEREIAIKSSETKDSKNSLQVVLLMYGMFQSPFLTQTDKHSTVAGIIKSTFNLLTLMGYEYSQFTFIVFKIMIAFRKVCGTDLQNLIYSRENQIKLLNLVNHNWENPIAGVRDSIKLIFKNLVSIIDSDFLRSIVQEINGFYWNKAKYLMLSEIIENYKFEVSLLSEFDWIVGLINSLHKPGLVSAGADMYYAILNKIYCVDIWCKLFLKRILEVLQGSFIKAIVNFGNYWLLTTLKKFPKLMTILINEFDTHGLHTDNEYYSILFLMKQGNKLGIFNRNWDSIDNFTNAEKTVLSAIEHNNTQIRMLAFDIICLISEKTMVNENEYILVLDYIKNNINSDCTVLRLNMLNSLNVFLSQLHILFRNNKDNIIEESLLNFCKDLQDIIITSLNLNGNYQRKCTNVKLINTIIDCLSQIPRKRKDHIKSSTMSLKEHLQRNSCWKFHDESIVLKIVSLLEDPSDDIRDNASKLLLNHYSDELRKTEMMNQIMHSALQSMKSKFFFEISCGRSMFKLIVNLLLKETEEESMFKSLDDVFDYGYKELLSEYELKRDVLQSIEDGKQLHSFISILQVVLETCIKNFYKLDISDKNMNELLDALQGITNQFTWEQQNSTSSDFSKMNEIIEDIIAKSGCSQNDFTDKDETKISGLHQIVLNCLWLNVKASCDLAYLIMNYYKNDVEKCEKCINIITHVLETSRHKGAIEAAGTALGCGIQLLTSLPENSNTSEIPQTLLKTKLESLIFEASKMASITRRGAGLSIMVHRIVASDMKKGKPLFHYFMKTLLKTCQNTEDVPSSQDIENQMDLPKAILIHFLTKIVMDSSLASDMMFYSAELAELAFNNLTSSHWQIRNAALQLYGALIPKLIGQKKASGTDDETIATVACDELRTHSPKLWKFITKQCKIKSHSREITSHSNLVPILNMLASCAKRYNFSFDSVEQRLSDDLLNSLMKILNSPIHTVRRLTAKCIFNIFSFVNICDGLKMAGFESENFIHGSLILMKLCHNYYNLQEIDANIAKDFADICKNVMKNRKQCSYFSKEIYTSIHSNTIVISQDDVKNVLAVLEERNNSPGVFNWAQTCIKIHLSRSQWENIPEVLTLLLKQNDFEIYCVMLLEKIERESCFNDSAMKKIVDILLNFEKKYESSVISKMLYEISSKIKLNVDVSAILKDINGKEMSYKLRYIIPFAAKYLMNIDEDQQEKLVHIISKMSDFENTDVDMRYIAALANNEIPKSFVNISDSIKIISLKTAIILLQDEDEDVRDMSIYYYKNIKNLQIAVQPNICLNNILDYKFLSSIFCESQSIVMLCTDLLKLLTCNAHNNTDDYNPFANDSKNIYLEIDMLRKSLENIMHNFE